MSGQSSDVMLEVAGVSKSYGRSKALRDISFEVRKGGKTLLLGPNGAGKSTLVKTIMGLHNFQGRIAIDGFDNVKEGSKARETTGYVPQVFSFYEGLTVEQGAKLIATVKGARPESALEKLEAVGLTRARAKSIHALSGGMRQRFGLAMALLTDPPFLVFDEPLASIDLRGQLGFLELVNRLASAGATFLIATHLSGLGDFADDAVVLHRGRMVARGAPSELLERINSDETVYLKPVAGRESEVVHAVESSGGRVTDSQGSPMVVTIPPGGKLALLRSLFSADDLVTDVSMEPAKIESSYTKLLQKAVGKIDK